MARVGAALLCRPPSTPSTSFLLSHAVTSLSQQARLFRCSSLASLPVERIEAPRRSTTCASAAAWAARSPHAPRDPLTRAASPVRAFPPSRPNPSCSFGSFVHPAWVPLPALLVYACSPLLRRIKRSVATSTTPRPACSCSSPSLRPRVICRPSDAQAHLSSSQAHRLVSHLQPCMWSSSITDVLGPAT
jgi:hypothetical protein